MSIADCGRRGVNDVCVQLAKFADSIQNTIKCSAMRVGGNATRQKLNSISN